ncbi:MAG: HPF/RaiA family ribosome-associated protein [Deltaproteobacteria bacterium]|nr:HPF/RaiA family ribosome-associated protein [Deltaproteobacteria bacterium]
MTEAIQIVFRDVPASPTLESNIRRKADRLLRMHRGITWCRTTILRPHTHQTKGVSYQVRVELHLLGVDLVVGKDHAFDGSHENPYVAARDAFRTAKRLLQEHIRKHRLALREHLKLNDVLDDDQDDENDARRGTLTAMA